MGSDAPLLDVPLALATVTPAPLTVPSANFRLGNDPELIANVFQKSSALTPMAANPVLLVTVALVKATSMRLALNGKTKLKLVMPPARVGGSPGPGRSFGVAGRAGKVSAPTEETPFGTP